MNAAAWRLEPAAMPAAPDLTGLALLAGLADFQTNPQRYLPPGRIVLPPLSPAETLAMARHPAFAGPIGRELTRHLGLPALAPGAAVLAALARPGPARLAVQLLVAPAASLARLAAGLAALVLSHRLVAAITREERQLLRNHLGDEAFTLGTREAPLLYPVLATLNGLPASLSLAALPAGALPALGHLVMQGLCATQDAGLAALFALRLPPDSAALLPAQALAPVEARHLGSILRYIARKEPSWSALTA